MRNIIAVMILVALIGICGCGQKTEEERAAASPGEMYITKVIERLSYTETLLDDITRAADEAASRIVMGGRIYITDDETIFRTGDEETQLFPGGGYNYPMHEDWGGFVAEACDRAGGLRHIQPVPVSGELTPRDVVLVGTLDFNSVAQVDQLKALKKNGVLLIIFGSRDSKITGLADYQIDNGLEAGIVPAMEIGGKKPIGPVGGMANVINMWTFTSEMVAAMTRLGKMPSMWQSMLIPGAGPRNERLGKFVFHPDLKVAPVKAGILGRQFLRSVKDMLEKIRATELDTFQRAGKLCAETIAGGRKVVASVIGHFMVTQRRMPDYPNIFTVRENEYGREYLEGLLDKDDVWLHVGYSYYPVRELKFAREAGARTVCVFTPGPSFVGEGTPETPDMSLVDIYIDPYWKHGDSVVEVPGYDTKIIPPSGVVMITCYWMLIGETLNYMPSAR